MASNEASQTPFDWVYDHPTRDIAELIRYMMIEKRKTGIKQSFNLLQIMNELFAILIWLALIICKAPIPAPLF